MPRLRDLPGFKPYWGSTALGGIASSIGGTIVPMIAATQTGASVAQMALLEIVGTTPSLLLQIPAAIISDSPRHRGVRALVVADALAAVTSLSIPALWLTHQLSFASILLAEIALALIGVTRFASATPVLTKLVPPGQLVDANGKLSGTRSATDIGGQGIAGVLLSTIAQPVALLLNAFAFIVSAILMAGVKLAPREDQTHGRRSADPNGAPRSSLSDVISICRRLVVRRDIVIFCGIALANGITSAAFILYATRVLKLDPGIIAWCVGAGATGGIIGGFTVGVLAQRLSMNRILTLGSLLIILSLAPMAFVGTGWPAALSVIGFEFFGALGGTAVAATVFGSVLGNTEQSQMSRTMAVMTNITQIAAIVGLAVGGYLGTAISLRGVILTATVISIGVGVVALVGQPAKTAERARS